MKYRTIRKLEPIVVAENMTRTLKLEDYWTYSALLLRLVVNCTVGVAGIVLADEGSARFIRRIEISSGGRVLQSITGPALVIHNMLWTGATPPHAEPAIVAGATSFNWSLLVPFKLWGSGSPAMTFLDPKRYTQIDLKVEFGLMTDMHGGAAADCTFTSGTMTVTGVEFMGRGEEFSSLNEHFVSWHPRDFAAATTQGSIELPKDRAIRGVLLRITDTATDRALSDALLNNIQLRYGNTVLWDMSYPEAVSLMHFERGIVDASPFGTATLPGAKLEGYLWLDLIEIGVENLFHPGGEKLELLLDVDAGTHIDAFVDSVY